MTTTRPQENWKSYLSFVDDTPASILVDISLIDIAPVEELPLLLQISIKMKNPRENGLPSHEESNDVLYPIDDKIQSVINDVKADILTAGCIKTDGIMALCFYHNIQDSGKKLELEQLILDSMKEFDGYQYSVSWEEDEGWSFYANLLFPNAWEFQTIMSFDLLRQMASSGDDTSKPRMIDHFIVCADAATQATIATEGTTLGFRTVSSLVNEERYGVELSQEGIPDNIDDIMWPLFELAQKHDVSYDGWGAVMVKNEE